MIKPERFWILECTEEHEEGHPCDGFMVTTNGHDEYVAIYRSRLLAELGASQLTPSDGSMVVDPPRPIEVEIRPV